MTHFIILPPQKFFSSTLQILGFIAESYHYYTVIIIVLIFFEYTRILNTQITSEVLGCAENILIAQARMATPIMFWSKIGVFQRMSTEYLRNLSQIKLFTINCSLKFSLYSQDVTIVWHSSF